MKYVAIDIETGGLDEKQHDILELAAVVEDTDKADPIESLPVFRRLYPRPTYRLTSFAARMHAELLNQLDKWPKGSLPIHAFTDFKAFLFDNGFSSNVRPTIAGKNFFGFDARFLREQCGFDFNHFSHRAIDPAMLYWRKDDVVLPSTDECLKRAGIEEVTDHTAVGDCRLVIRLIREAMKNR